MASQVQSGQDLAKIANNLKVSFSNLVVTSNIPLVCKEESCILGVDEAGRGPVLGPMVYGISYCPLSKKDEFASLGCDDSKALTEKKREDLFTVLCACEEYVGWAADIISPTYISNSMLKRSKRSLNEVAEESTVGLIRQTIESGVKVAEIYVDTVGPPEKYRDKLLKHFPECKITVAKKADSLYPIVSGASICAKVTRDRVITNWNFVEDIGDKEYCYGSGYPNDPGTKSFLAENIDKVFGFPNLVRFSWSTCAKILEKEALPVEWETDEDENEPSVKKYFSVDLIHNQHEMVQSFFKDNNICNIISF